MPPPAPILMRGLARLGHSLLDTLLPAQCLGCGAIVDRASALCPLCWRGLRFLEQPLCGICGFPFEIDAGPDATCAACTRRRPTFARARSAIAYDDASRGLILMFKQGDRTDAAPVFATWMIRAGRELIADADLIAPVPLHWTRLFRRRYNQAALLAQAIAKRSERPSVPDLLVRRRRTDKLGHLGPAARMAMVKGAIAVRGPWQTRLADKRILLIDDVLTTGATVRASTGALLAAGAAAVDILTLARVVRPNRG
jgi:ComF family protein